MGWVYETQLWQKSNWTTHNGKILNTPKPRMSKDWQVNTLENEPTFMGRGKSKSGVSYLA